MRIQPYSLGLVTAPEDSYPPEGIASGQVLSARRELLIIDYVIIPLHAFKRACVQMVYFVLCQKFQYYIIYTYN